MIAMFKVSVVLVIVPATFTPSWLARWCAIGAGTSGDVFDYICVSQDVEIIDLSLIPTLLKIESETLQSACSD